MTYCVAMKLKKGVLLVSDTRSNAGVDSISVFCKMHRFEVPGDRSICMVNAGNLATTQEVVNLLKQDILRQEIPNLHTVTSMFDVAKLLGKRVREVIESQPTEQHKDIDFSCSFIVGGQIHGEEPRLFRVYAQGNFIEATEETPFFQIGESKYGKPILDRVLNIDMPVKDAILSALISFDSTIKSNLSVGMPLDLCLLLPNTQTAKTWRVTAQDPFVRELRSEWSNGLRSLFEALPRPDWLNELE
jgi:putative proteasome-type protease